MVVPGDDGTDDTEATRVVLVHDDRLTGRLREVRIPVNEPDPKPVEDDPETVARTRAAVARLLADMTTETDGRDQ